MEDWFFEIAVDYALNWAFQEARDKAIDEQEDSIIRMRFGFRKGSEYVALLKDFEPRIGRVCNLVTLFRISKKLKKERLIKIKAYVAKHLPRLRAHRVAQEKRAEEDARANYGAMRMLMSMGHIPG